MDIRVLMREEGEMWVAQCVDFDIAAQGRTPVECRRNMNDQLSAEAKCSLEGTGNLFGGIPKPPASVEADWSCADNAFKMSDHLALNNSNVAPEYRMVG